MPGAVNSEIRVPEIRSATASILYINAVGILNDATASQMLIKDFEKNANLSNRLSWLEKRGKLLDFANLSKLCDRRNDIAHELQKSATVDELDAACSLIISQLVAWNLVEPGPKYEIYIERGAMRETKEPEFYVEHDRIIQVIRGSDVVYEAKQTVRFGEGGA